MTLTTLCLSACSRYRRRFRSSDTPIDQVPICRDGSPARIVAPDSRWFALRKLWMSAQAKRNPLKRAKDLKQGMLLLGAVAEAMPHYPPDEGFAAALPGELAQHYLRWSEQRGAPTPPSW